MQQHSVSQWTPVDNSTNRLELGRADDTPDLIGLRSSHASGNVIFTTDNQLSQFVQAARSGKLDQFIKNS